MSEDLTMMSATEMVASYRKKRVSPVAVIRAVLDRIQAYNDALNAFCLVDEEYAMASAKAAEDRWQKGKPIGLVDGVPTTIKDTYLVKGWPARRGSLTSPDDPCEEDAAAPARLREHGAVLIGKTTTPEFGWKAVTDSRLTGITRNPWNTERTPGGSSGGACVTAATGMGALHLGGDGGGSIRIPAAFCGVYGFKANYGRVPVYPQLTPGTLTHLGPVTRTVTDAALMLTVIAEPDTRDWLALPYEKRDYRMGLEEGVRGLHIGFSKNFGYVDVDPEIADLAVKATAVFEDLGAVVEEADPGFQNPRHAFDVYYYSLFTYMLEGMSDQERNLLDPGLVEIAEEGKRFGVRDLMDAEMTRAAIARQMDRFHQTYDLLISPQVPLAAFEVGVEFPQDSGMKRWLDWSPFTYPFNFTGQPTASVPCGFNHEGLPIAIQIVGPRFAEHLVLRASRAYESIRPFIMPPLPNDTRTP
jgi:aspartyl-tRNA(Asn)/glutamyl-tRNA(Gln) amidotransferase subunit A